MDYGEEYYRNRWKTQYGRHPEAKNIGSRKGSLGGQISGLKIKGKPVPVSLQKECDDSKSLGEQLKARQKQLIKGVKRTGS